MGVELTRNEIREVPAEVIKVLVVDHDSTCLKIVSRMLLFSGYQVVTAKSAMDALRKMRDEEDDLHLILTEVHLPDMGKYEFLEKIMEQQSKLPLIIMSADDDETSKLGCLFKGAMLYLVKPITMKSVRNLWQFSLMNMKGRSYSRSSSERRRRRTFVNDESSSSVVLVKNNNNNNGRKRSRRSKVDSELKNKGRDESWKVAGSNSITSIQKKPKLIWTQQLHSRFLQAITVLGIENAHPKEILEHMNVPGLKKENISSHLQKYRLSLKRDRDRNRNRDQYQDQNNHPSQLYNSHMNYPEYANYSSSIIHVGDSCAPPPMASTPKPTFLLNSSETSEQQVQKEQQQQCATATAIVVQPPPPPPPPSQPRMEERGDLQAPSEDHQEWQHGNWFEYERDEEMGGGGRIALEDQEGGHEQYCMFDDVDVNVNGMFDMVRASTLTFQDEDFQFDDLWQ